MFLINSQEQNKWNTYASLWSIHSNTWCSLEGHTKVKEDQKAYMNLKFQGKVQLRTRLPTKAACEVFKKGWYSHPRIQKASETNQQGDATILMNTFSNTQSYPLNCYYGNTSASDTSTFCYLYIPMLLYRQTCGFEWWRHIIFSFTGILR